MYYRFIIVQYLIDDKRRDYDEKMNKYDSKLDKLTEIDENMMDCIQIYNYSPNNMDSPKSQDPTTVVSSNNKAPPLEGINYPKIGGMQTLKHEISSPKFYELLIKTELNGSTGLDLNNFYNHIKICLN